MEICREGDGDGVVVAQGLVSPGFVQTTEKSNGCRQGMCAPFIFLPVANTFEDTSKI